MYDPGNKVTKVYSGEKSYVASKYYLNLFIYYFGRTACGISVPCRNPNQ